jgi:hypothetical protein
MDKGSLKTALQIAKECLKDCQNFIREFPQGTEYHDTLSKSVIELNSLIDEIGKKLNPNTNDTLKQSTDSKITKEENNSSNIKEESKSDKEEDKASSNKYPKTKILNDETREQATKLAQSDMSFEDFPKSSLGFEKAYGSMRKRLDVFFNYLKYFKAETLPSTFSSSEMSAGLIVPIINTLKTYGLDNEENALITVSYLAEIPKTKNFSLVKKFLKKAEKEGKLYNLIFINIDLKNLFIQLKENYTKLLTNSDFDKIWF